MLYWKEERELVVEIPEDLKDWSYIAFRYDDQPEWYIAIVRKDAGFHAFFPKLEILAEYVCEGDFVEVCARTHHQVPDSRWTELVLLGSVPDEKRGVM